MQFLNDDFTFSVVKMQSSKPRKPYSSLDKKRKPDYTEERKRKKGWQDDKR